ncbi:MAG: glycosyltransferase family 2 protein [Bdellovibrionales bacterium]|nr:glycosyltransferase family 2 protein [Bdellovibrionales bacterium]
MQTLSIIVPVYNEANHLEKVIKRLYAAPCPIGREFIFVNDCSSDESSRILKQLQSQFGYTLLEHSQNQGKGSAIITGIAKATGDYVMIHDADFEYDPNEIPALLRPLTEDRADVVYGSRFRDGNFQVHRTYHYFVNAFLTLLSNLLSGVRLTDMETCYKIFRRDLLQAMRLQSRRFGIEVELTAYLGKIRVRIYELPISYFPRTRLQGKKINWKDGVAALFHLVRFNWLTKAAEAFSNLPPQYRI